MMADAIDVLRKKRGRPATGLNPAICTRFPADMVQAIERYAAEHSIDRSEAVRRLINKALVN
jgi:hypothetical protein